MFRRARNAPARVGLSRREQTYASLLRAIPLGIALALSAGCAFSQQSASHPLDVRPVMWAPSEHASDVSLGNLRFRGGLELTSSDPEFNGYSGVWVSPDGRSFAAVQGPTWTTARLTYDNHGDLAGMRSVRTGPLLDERGQPFADDADKDSEALDFDGERFVVGFETRDRILTYDSFQARATRVPLPPEALDNVVIGAGISAVAALPGGGLLELPERTPFPGQSVFIPSPTRGWLITPSAQGAVSLRAAFGWLPISLSAFPNGDVLALEIQLQADGSVRRTRLGRIPAGEVTIGGTMTPQPLAVIGPPIAGSRLEGSSIRTGANGETLIYLVSQSRPAVLYMFELSE